MLLPEVVSDLNKHAYSTHIFFFIIHSSFFHSPFHFWHGHDN